MPTGSRRGLSIALAVVSSALIAACGSSGKPSHGTGTDATGVSTAYSLRLTFSNCMRSHGVSGFPDPPVNGGPFTRSSLEEQSPAFRSAQQACKKLLPGGNSQGSPLPASQQRAAVANAQCMRKHGVPDFPDPRFPSHGGSVIQLPAAINADSPSFLTAQRICGRP